MGLGYETLGNKFELELEADLVLPVVQGLQGAGSEDDGFGITREDLGEDEGGAEAEEEDFGLAGVRDD